MHGAANVDRCVGWRVGVAGAPDSVTCLHPTVPSFRRDDAVAGFRLVETGGYNIITPIAAAGLLGVHGVTAERTTNGHRSLRNRVRGIPIHVPNDASGRSIRIAQRNVGQIAEPK